MIDISFSFGDACMNTPTDLPTYLIAGLVLL
jgi:hypothetical protein